eukprot:6459932-Amphidinium_carterae.1
MGHVFGHWGEDTFLDWEPRLTLPPVQMVEAVAPHIRPSAKNVPRKRTRILRDVISDEQRETVARQEVIASWRSIVDDCDE